MNNTILVTIPFSFRGKDFEPSVRIDLDELAASTDPQAWLTRRVAAANGIDPYSYEFEMLESTLPVFSDPQGQAAEFLEEGSLDLNELRHQYRQGATLDKLQTMAKETLGTAALEQYPDILDAMMKAYQAGQADTD